MSYRISRASYADMFGPTVGDRVRLADTDLIIEVEKDFGSWRFWSVARSVFRRRKQPTIAQMRPIKTR